jgi:hypothetical protein
VSTPSLSPLFNASFDELDRHFNSMKLDESRKHYQLGAQVRPPLGTMCPEITSLFLTSPEGKMLYCVVKQLIKNKRLIDKTPIDFFCRMNTSLQEGSCYGEAQAIMLSRRPKITTDSKEKRIREYVDAIFFQVQHELSFFQKDDLVLQIQRLDTERKQLAKKSSLLQKKLKTTQAQKENILQVLHVLKTNKNKKRAAQIKWHKQQVKVLNRRISRHKDESCKINQKVIRISSKISRIFEKFTELDNFKSQLDQEAKKKWAEKKLTVFKEVSFARYNTAQDYYLLSLKKKLTNALSNKSASDFLLTFNDDVDPHLNHTILVQPSHPRLYDANVGEILYGSLDDIVFDLQHYCEDKEVNCIDIEFIKES